MDARESYRTAQRAIADLKAAVLAVVQSEGERGLSNAEVGRMLGIYGGHSASGHVGHVPRFLLERLKEEEVVSQGDDKRWRAVPQAGLQGDD